MPNLNTLAFQKGQNIQSKLQSMTGNPGQMMSPGIYKNITNGGLSQYTVRLTSNDSNAINVQGLLTENFSFNIDATWDALDAINGLASTNPFLETIAKLGTTWAGMAGIANPVNTGISTRKMYKQSGYLILDIKFRVVDWKGLGDPVKAAFSMASMCLPKNFKNYTAEQLVSEGGDILISTLTNAISLIPKADKIASGLETDLTNRKNDLLKLTEMPLDGVQKIIPGAKSVGDVLADSQFFVLASAPSPITVKIGNYFRHNDMVVQNVKCDFSKQATSSGPLYADFDINISSRQAILLNSGTNTDQELGLMIRGQNRVTYEAPTSSSSSSLNTSTSSSLNRAPQTEIASA